MNRFILIIGLALSCNALSAQHFSVNVSTDSMLIGNYIRVSFELENIEGEFEAPSFEAFEVLSGPNVSSSVQIINGDKSSTKTYSYLVKPQELGLYTIAPAYLDTNGSTLETDLTVINVYPNPENIIEEPQQEIGTSFFQFGNGFPFNRDGLRREPEMPQEATPKRKYKRI